LADSRFLWFSVCGFFLSWCFGWVVLFGGSFSRWFLGQVKFMVTSICLFQMVVGFFMVSKSVFVGVKTALGNVQIGQ
jgi:hypothetical protein